MNQTKNSNFGLIVVSLIFVLILAIGGGYAFWLLNWADDEVSTAGEVVTRTTESQVLVDRESGSDEDSISMGVDLDTTSKSATPGVYADYSTFALAEAEGEVVLFFAADWCPSCRTLENDINANLDNIPADLTILKIDYDSETKLKREYGVTYQHTLVKVDNSGAELGSWAGSFNLDDIISQLETI